MENKKEIYYDLKGFEGIYVISKLGNIKTKTTNSKTSGRKPTGKILKQKISNSGYLTIPLRKEKKQKNYLVHRLLCIQFLENPENKKCVNHKDSNRTNNNLENLEWCTHSENNSHAHKFGGQKIYVGEKHSQNVLTEKKVLSIREKYNTTKISMNKLAEENNCSKSAIQAILERKTWKHI